MSVFPEFARALLFDGTVRLRHRLVLEPEGRSELEEVLRHAFDIHSSDVAGPPIEFDLDIATRAIQAVLDTCWFLVSKKEHPNEVSHSLSLPSPESASQHLSADLSFRFLPMLYRRAATIDPNDVLTKEIERVLLEWPLSGVLASLKEQPTTELTFDGHPGLCLLYEERRLAALGGTK